jgi:hypothetical protein
MTSQNEPDAELQSKQSKSKAQVYKIVVVLVIKST